MHSAVKPETAEYENSFRDDPEIEECFRHCFEERRKRHGEQSRLIGFVGTLFPNTSFHANQPRGLCVWHPHGPTETEAWRFFLVDADAPAKVKNFMRSYYMRYSGPVGMTEQDDMENWLYATAASKGAIARRHPFNYQQSLGNAEHDPVVHGLKVKGEVSQKMSEHMARHFYRRWGDYLEGADWQTLLGNNDARFQASGAAE